MEEFVELEILEAVDEKLIADDDKVETVVAINVKAKGGMQEVLSIKSMTPTSDNKCHAPQVSEESFFVEMMPNFEQVLECKGVGMLNFGTPMLQEEPHVDVEDIRLEESEMKVDLEQDVVVYVCLELPQGQEDALDANIPDDMPNASCVLFVVEKSFRRLPMRTLKN